MSPRECPANATNRVQRINYFETSQRYLNSSYFLYLPRSLHVPLGLSLTHFIYLRTNISSIEYVYANGSEFGLLSAYPFEMNGPIWLLRRNEVPCPLF
jgi:hypothetical protein